MSYATDVENLETLVKIQDNAVNAIQERFNQMQEYCALFGFLYDILNLKDKNEADILMQCKKFESALTHNSCKDIDGEDLCWELQSVSRRLPKVMGPSEVLLFILRHDLQNSVPNIYVALRILLTLPVSVASGERSFSRLKLIKTYLRSTMTEERLVGLATISIEQELAYNLDLLYVFVGEHIALIDFVKCLQKRKLLETGDYVVVSVDDEIYDPNRRINIIKRGK
nr:uncharacterized protein LOC111416258 [Onthophagus taurus]